PNGSEDSTFGPAGRQTANFGGDDQAFAVAIQPDGKIVAAGQGAATKDFCVARFTDTFGLDTAAFGGGDGLVNITFGNVDVATGVALQGDGKIVGGFTDFSGTNNFAAARLTADGTLDTSFNEVDLPFFSTPDNGDGR